MYEITYTFPESKHTKSKILKMDEDQTELYEIIKRNFQGVPMRKTGNVWLNYHSKVSKPNNKMSRLNTTLLAKKNLTIT